MRSDSCLNPWQPLLSRKKPNVLAEMNPVFSQTSTPLKLTDFFLLGDVFRQVVEEHLPVSATVLFWSRLWELEQGTVYTGPDPKWQQKLAAQCKTFEPAYLLDMLVIPVVVSDGEKAALLVQDVDPALIEKMDRVIIIESKSIYEYLRQLEDIGEEMSEYTHVYGYSVGETEPRLSLFRYLPYEFKVTDSFTNLKLPENNSPT